MKLKRKREVGITKIAHVSDFHLRHHLPGPVRGETRLGRLVPTLLPPVIEDLREQKVDFLAVTGDLLCYQYRDDIGPETSGQAIQDLHLLKGILLEVGCPIVVIPGNHDPEELVHRVFGPFPEERSIKGFRVLCFRDSYVPGDFPGRVEKERDRLVKVLADDDPRAQIHLRHGVIWPTDGNLRERRRADRRSLAESIGRSGRVRLVLSGHRHAGFPPSWVCGTVFSTVPGFSDPPHPYRIYSLRDGVFTSEQRSAL